MLKEILAEFDREDAPLDLNELSRRLNIQSSALEGMITTLVRQGKLQSDAAADPEQGAVSCSSGQCAGCSAASQCPFISKIPRTYERVRTTESRKNKHRS
ncbi:FeoC-like transcriptional regulator [bacterium]|nr:FeoC-like transcriptional regulator [bacterium]